MKEGPFKLTKKLSVDSADNCDIFRKRGYGMRGKQRIQLRCEFTRNPRCILLCFLGRSGILQTICTEGTFDRYKFINCCRKLLQSGEIYPYPGRHSVWIMDGASIHCDPNIVYYLLSLGIRVIYLFAYLLSIFQSNGNCFRCYKVSFVEMLY